MKDKGLVKAEKGQAIAGLTQIERAADYIVKSRLFGVNSKEQAVALMLLAQAEGIHPMRAIQEYHIIQGRPAMKADAMLARFLQAGGKVQWHELSDEAAEATFSHPQGGSVRIRWDLKRAKQAGLTDRENWKKYPRAMLRARVISEGIRTVYPAVCVGVYTPEEVMDLEEPAPPPPAEVVEAEVVEKAPPRPQEKQKKKSAEDSLKDKVRVAAKIKDLQFTLGISDDELLSHVRIILNRDNITSLKQLRECSVEELEKVLEGLEVLKADKEKEPEREAFLREQGLLEEVAK